MVSMKKGAAPVNRTRLYLLSGTLTLAFIALSHTSRTNVAHESSADLLTHDTSASPAKTRDSAFDLPLSERKFLFYGNYVDEPRVKCSGLTHQAATLRCALEEAWLLNRTFVLPRMMCMKAEHSILPPELSQGKAAVTQLPLSSFFDVAAINASFWGGVTHNDSREWQQVVGEEGGRVVEVENKVSVQELGSDVRYKEARVVRRHTENFWLLLCWKRVLTGNNFKEIEYAPALRRTAQKIAEKLGDFDFLHVRRGDKLVHRDRNNRLIFPRLDRETRPKSVLTRIKKWVPRGRTIYLATNEFAPGFFAALDDVYMVKRYSSFVEELNPIVQSDLQLYAIEKLIAQKARIQIGTFLGEVPGNRSLSNFPSKGKPSSKNPITSAYMPRKKKEGRQEGVSHFR